MPILKDKDNGKTIPGKGFKKKLNLGGWSQSYPEPKITKTMV